MFDPHNAYVTHALQQGIPLEVIQSFIARNPGDYHRILSALGGSREALAVAGYQGAATGGGDALAHLNIPAPAAPFLPPTFDFRPGATNVMYDPELFPNLSGSYGEVGYGASPQFLGGLGPLIGTIGGLLPGPVGPIIGAIGGLLPRPGTPSTPRLPLPPGPGGLPPVTTIPVGGGARVGRAKAAKIAAAAAAAAAAGLTLEQYLALNPNALKTNRRLNVLNPKALRRAGRRVEGFACFARKMISFSDKTRIKGVRKGCRKRRACAA
jgi:hypothetical protein